MFKSQLYLLLAVGSRFRIWLYHPPLPGAGGLKKECQVTWNRTSGSSKGALHWITGKYLLRRLMKTKVWGLWVWDWGLWGSEWPLFNLSGPFTILSFQCFRMLRLLKVSSSNSGACCFIIRSLLHRMSWTHLLSYSSKYQ